MHGITLVEADAAVRQVAVIMRQKNIGSVLVTKQGEIVGILTERDILKRVVAEGLDPSRTTAEQIMTRNIITINADATVFEAAEMLNRYDIRRLPVEENGKIVGIVTARSIAKSMPLAVVRITKPESYYQSGIF
ncbi:MAG: CBS domain-containing protein [Candidatus Micrarchaeia archaeon]